MPAPITKMFEKKLQDEGIQDLTTSNLASIYQKAEALLKEHWAQQLRKIMKVSE